MRATTRAGSTSPTARPTASRSARSSRAASRTCSSQAAASRRRTTRTPLRGRWGRAWRWARPQAPPRRSRRSRSGSLPRCFVRGCATTGPMSAAEAIRAARLVAILRRTADVDAQVARLAAAGARVVEVTLDSDDALGAIERARARGDLTVLAGTVRTPAQVDAAVSAGAEAIVSPGLFAAVLERAGALDVPAIPG